MTIIVSTIIFEFDPSRRSRRIVRRPWTRGDAPPPRTAPFELARPDAARALVLVSAMTRPGESPRRSGRRDCLSPRSSSHRLGHRRRRRRAPPLGAARRAAGPLRLIRGSSLIAIAPRTSPADPHADGRRRGAGQRGARRRCCRGAKARLLSALITTRFRAARRRTSSLGAAPALLAIHSFTPELLGQKRPWQIGMLYGRMPAWPGRSWRGSGAIARSRSATTSLIAPPRRPTTPIPVHGEARGLSTRRSRSADGVADAAGARAWAERLAAVYEGIQRA